MAGSTLLITTLLANAFLAGLLLALPAGLHAGLAAHFGFSDRRTRRFRWLTHLLLVPLMLVTVLLIDKWGVPTVLLVGCILAEQHDEWQTGRRYFSAGSIAKLTTGEEVAPLPLMAAH